MSHELTMRSNGKAEMAYVGAKPWHGLGEELQAGAPIERWLTAAGMDWKVLRSKVRYATDRKGTLQEWPDYEVLMRSDTHAPVGLVSDGFQIVQPREVLEFFRDLVEVAGFALQTAGTLRGGRKFWALADLKTQDAIVGKDMVKGRLLVATACDGSMKTVVKNLAERVVCANTLRIAMNEKGAPEIAVSHRSRFNAAQVKQQLGLSVGAFHRFIVEARTLAARRVSKEEAREYVATLVKQPDADDDLEIVVKQAQDSRAFQRIMDLFEHTGRGSQLPGVRGTAWGLLNAVTEYVDHDRSTRGEESNRLNSAWFGSGQALKIRAYDAARVLVQ